MRSLIKCSREDIRHILWFTLLVHIVLFLWFCSSWNRMRIVLFEIHEVPSEADIYIPPTELVSFGYVQDTPEELYEFKQIATEVIHSKSDDMVQFRQLADYLYQLRKPSGVPIAGVHKLSEMFSRMQSGDPASCGYMSAVLASMARSLGFDTRGVVWSNSQGDVLHSGLEIFSTQYNQWVYYDSMLNGYATDSNGRPLSIAVLRPMLLTGEAITYNRNETLHDWDPEFFRDFIKKSPNEWFLMSNRRLYYEPHNRFGVLNWAAPVLSRLPYPADRVIDILTGNKDIRLVVQGKVSTGSILTASGVKTVVYYLLTVNTFSSLLLFATRKRKTIPQQDYDKLACKTA